MKIYSTTSCIFSLQNNTSAGVIAGTLLELNLSGNYVLEMISSGTSGAAGAYTFKYAGAYSSVTDVKQNKTRLVIANNTLYVDLNGVGESNAKIFNVAGVMVINKILNTTANQISTSSLPKGTYFVQIENNHISDLHKVVLR